MNLLPFIQFLYSSSPLFKITQSADYKSTVILAESLISGKTRDIKPWVK
jgi:hypothetical protein